MQLDIFDHSCDVMLRNDVGAALARRDAFAARSAWHLFKDECPTDETVPALAVCSMRWVAAPTSRSPTTTLYAMRVAC